MEIQKCEYLENEASFLEEINIFNYLMIFKGYHREKQPT